MKKVAFFFGAGVEGKDNFEIKTGYEYLKSSLFVKETLKGFNYALASFFGQNKYFNNTFSYRKDIYDATTYVLKNFTLQKASYDLMFFQKHKNTILAILYDEDIRYVCKIHGFEDVPRHISNGDDDLENIKIEFKKVITCKAKKYSMIRNLFLKDLFKSNSADEIEFDLNVGIGGSFDSYFHTIIDPYKYGVIKFSKVFNYYWGCYFSILHDVVKFLVKHGQQNFEKYLTDEMKLNYLFVLQNIELLTKELYSVHVDAIVPENAYYKIIKLKLSEYENQVECMGVITTNYYRFCETVSPNTIYLNGQLKWFEYPELIEIKDLSKEKGYDNKLVFPFIFGQSLVKPIVNPIQTEEFHRLHELLNSENNVDILVILGFNINEDDNHINSFLHDYVKKGKKLIVVSDADNNNVSKKLRCLESEVYVCKVDYKEGNKAIVNKIFEAILNSNV